jgi:hypothetical protein
MPHVIALYGGRAGSLATSKGTVRTAIAKAPVAGRVLAGFDASPATSRSARPRRPGPRALPIPARALRALGGARRAGLRGEQHVGGGARAGRGRGRGDAIEAVSRARHGVTVFDAVRARFGPPDPELVAAVLAVPELAEEWRVKTAPRLARAA